MTLPALLRSPQLRFWGGLLLVQGLFCALLTWPAAISWTGEQIWGGAPDGYYFAWGGWWVQKALFSDHEVFFSRYIWWPNGAHMALHTFAFLKVFLGMLLTFALSWAEIYSLLILATFFASGVTAFLLAYDSVGEFWPATLASVIFAYSPYRFVHAPGHMNLMTTEFLPIFFLCLIRLCDGSPGHLGGRAPEHRRWWAVGLGVAYGLTWLSSFIYGVFLLLVVPLVLAFGKRLPKFKEGTIAGGVIAVLIAPLAIPLFGSLAEKGFPHQTRGEDLFSLDLIAFVLPSHSSHFTGWILSWYLNTFPHYYYEGCERVGYLGFGALALGVVAFIRLPGLRHWKVLLVSCMVLSLGPELRIHGIETGIPLPAKLLQHIPIIGFIRTPNRFQVLTFLALGILVGHIWSRWRSSISSAGWRWLAAGFVWIIVMLDYNAVPVRFEDATVPATFRNLTEHDIEGGVFVLNDGVQNLDICYYQTAFNLPVVAGFVARFYPEEERAFHAVHTSILNSISLLENDLIPPRDGFWNTLAFFDIDAFIIDAKSKFITSRSWEDVAVWYQRFFETGPSYDDGRYLSFIVPEREVQEGWTLGRSMLLGRHEGQVYRYFIHEGFLHYLSRSKDDAHTFRLRLHAPQTGSVQVEMNGEKVTIDQLWESRWVEFTLPVKEGLNVLKMLSDAACVLNIAGTTRHDAPDPPLEMYR